MVQPDNPIDIMHDLVMRITFLVGMTIVDNITVSLTRESLPDIREQQLAHGTKRATHTSIH